MITEALLYFLSEKKVCLSLEFPDEAIDHVFTLKPLEIKFILKEWSERSEEWKTGITHIFGYLRMTEGGEILLKALHEEEEEIVEQALFSIHQSVTEEIEDSNKLTYKFASSDLKKLNDSLDQRKQLFGQFPEFLQLKNALQNYTK